MTNVLFAFLEFIILFPLSKLCRRSIMLLGLPLLLAGCLTLILVFPANAAQLVADKNEIAVGERITIRLDGITELSKTGWKTSPEGIVRFNSTSNNEATVTGVKAGRTSISAKVLSNSYSLYLTVLEAPDKTDPKKGWHTKIEGMAKVLGFPDTDTRIVRMLAEVQDGSRLPYEFYADLAKIPANMFDVIRVRSKLVDGHPDFARDVLGKTFAAGGTPVEMDLLAWRRNQTLAAIDEVVKRFVDAGRVPKDSVSLIISHVGKWATQEKSALTFTGDIDFSFVSSTDVELAEAMKDSFSEVIKQRTGLNPRSLDSVATAHGRAGLEVYIGKHGMAFAEEQLKINQLVNMNTGKKTDIEIQDVTKTLARERSLAESAGKQPPKPVHDTEPGLSMEMVRHFGHDIVKPSIYDMANSVVKAAKYLDRSYKSLEAAKGTPADPDLAEFAKQITEWANTKPQTVEIRESMVKRISEYLGTSPKVVFDQDTQKLVLSLDAGQIAAFHEKATQAMWKTVEQGSTTRIQEMEIRMQDLTERKHQGENVDDEVAKLREDMKSLIDMVEAEVKAFKDVAVPKVVIDNNAKVRALMNILSGRFGTKVLSEEELKDKKFVEELLKAEGDHGSEMRRQMTAAYIMERSVDALIRSPEFAMSGVEKTNQMLDFIDDRLLGSIRGETGFTDFETEMKLIRQTALDPKTRPGVLKELNALKSHIALGIKTVNQKINQNLQSTSAGRQGMKFMMVYGLADEMKSYRDAFNNEGWGGFATEIFRRRIPLGSAVEGAIMGNTYRAGWDVITTLIPPFALPEAAWGLGTMIGTQASSTYWSEQLALFVDTLYDSATFKLEAMEQHENAKVGVYRLVSVKHRGIPIDLTQFTEMRKEQVEALRQKVGKGHIDWAAYDKEFQGLTRWTEVDTVLQKNIADSDPGLALIEEMMKHEKVGPRLMERLTEKGLVRWEEVKLGFITNLIKRLEERKQADQALGAGMLPDMFLELRKIASELEIEDAVLRGLDAEVDTNNLKKLVNWLWETKRNVQEQAPTESETTRAAQVVKKYLDVYRKILDLRSAAKNQLAPGVFQDGSTTYLTGKYFLNGRAERDLETAQGWVKHIGQSQTSVDEALLKIKKRYAPNATLDDQEDKRYQEHLFPHQLWMKPYRTFASSRSDSGVLGLAVVHNKELKRLMNEYEKGLKIQNIVELTVVLKDKADKKVIIENAQGRLTPTDLVGNPATAEGSAKLLFTAASGRYRLTVEAPGYEPAGRDLLLGRNLNPLPKINLDMKSTAKVSDKDKDKEDREKAGKMLVKAQELAAKGSYDEAIAMAEEARKLDPKNPEIPQLIKKWTAEKQKEQERIGEERRRQAERERQEAERLEKERAREQAEKDRIEAEQTAAWKQKIREEQKRKVPPTCTYQYSEWGECSRATRKHIRSVTGVKPEGCVEKGKPELEQECTPPPTAKELKEQLMGCLCRASGGYRYTPDECAKGRPGDGVCSWSGPLGGFWCHHMKPTAEKAAECYEIVYGKKANSAELSQLEKDIRDADKKNIKPLKVTLAPDAKPIKAQYGTTVSLTANAEGGLTGYTYSWSGQGSPKDNTFSFINTRKPGTYGVSVTVSDSDGGSATAATSIVVEAITVTIEKTSPSGNTVPVGGQASFKATVTGAADVNYLWQPHPEVEFNPFEKSTTTTATFRNPGSVGVWVDVLVKEGAVMRSAGRSNIITMQVVNPQWALEFSPANPRVGQPIKAKISPTGPVAAATNTAEMNFRWQLPANAKQTGTSQDDREITFVLKDTKPANISCTAATKRKNENLGGAGKTIAAQGFEVKVSGPRGRQEFQIWKCETQLGGAPACGMKKVENQFAAGNEILFGATVEPTPEKPVSYNWTVSPSGCSIASPFSRDIGMTCSSTGSFTVKVSAKSDDMEIGSSSANVSVSISQNDINKSNKAKEAYEKLQKAKELVSQGKLNEGIALIDEALKLDPKHAEAAALGPKLKVEKQTVMKHVESIKKLLPTDNIAQAEKELAAAQKLHPKYSPVVEVEKSLNEAKKKIDEKKIKEEEAKKNDQEQKDKQAQKLADEGYGLEKKGDLAGAIRKYQEAVKIVPDKGTSDHITELQKKIKNQKEKEEEARKEEALKAEQGRKDKQAQKLADEGYSLEKKGDLAGAIKKYQAAVKIVPDESTSDHIAELQNKIKEEEAKKKEDAKKDKQEEKDKQAQKLADEGYSLEKKGDLAGAIKKYQAAVKIVPDKSTSDHIAELQKKIKEEEAKNKEQATQKQLDAQAKHEQGKQQKPTTGYWRLTGTDGDTVFANPGPEWSRKEDFSTPDSASFYSYLKGELIHQSNFTWTELPEKVYPGQVFPLTAQGKVVFHKDPWFVSGGLLIQFYGAMNPYWRVGDAPRPDTGTSDKVTLDAKVPIGDPDKSKEKHYLRIRFSISGTTNTNPFTYIYEWIPDASVTNSGSMTTSKPGKESVIFFNGNDSGVSPGGKSPRFNIDRAVQITFLFTYHNGYKGEPGTIRIVSAKGAVIGTWKARGRAGSTQPSWYWEITPDVRLQPGSYRIETSNPGSWSQNSGSGGNGMVQIKGVYLNP